MIPVPNLPSLARDSREAWNRVQQIRRDAPLATRPKTRERMQHLERLALTEALTAEWKLTRELENQ